MRLLDAGCGPGSITVGLAETVTPGEAVGIDTDPAALEDARELASERGCTNVRFEQEDIDELPFEDGSFDAAFVHAVLQHVAEPVAALAELRRVLRPGGVIGVADADLDSMLLWPATPLLERANALSVRLRELDGGSPRVGRQLREVLHMAGFVEITSSVAPRATTTAESNAQMAGFSAYLLEQPQILERVVGAGLATPGEMQEMAAAWRVWGAEPGAFSCGLWCQAVARVP